MFRFICFVAVQIGHIRQLIRPVQCQMGFDVMHYTHLHSLARTHCNLLFRCINKFNCIICCQFFRVICLQWCGCCCCSIPTKTGAVRWALVSRVFLFLLRDFCYRRTKLTAFINIHIGSYTHIEIERKTPFSHQICASSFSSGLGSSSFYFWFFFY